MKGRIRFDPEWYGVIGKMRVLVLGCDDVQKPEIDALLVNFRMKGLPSGFLLRTFVV